MSSLKPIPTSANVIDIGDNHASKNCKRCSDPADYYVFVTNGEANEKLGTSLDHGQWPFNQFLCGDCFADPEAERTQDWSDLV